MKQGGSRRGLPQSFLNRFVQVHIRLLNSTDYFSILQSKFSHIPHKTLQKMIEFNAQIQQNQPPTLTSFEFNLRDLFRWCEAANSAENDRFRPESAVELIYCARARSADDRAYLRETFERVFEVPIAGDRPTFYANAEWVYVGDASVSRAANEVNTHVLMGDGSCLVLRKQLEVLRSLMYCVNLKWMSILVSTFFEC